MPYKDSRKMSLAERVKLRGDDLWPEDIAAAEGELPPITILKQQASLLGRRTRNLVEAEVETTGSTDFPGYLRHILFLVAPALNFYRHSLLEVEHDATHLYPATINASRSGNGPSKRRHIRAKNSDEFKEALKEIFADDETKKTIGSLLAQSGGAPSGS
jgi:hypothetical protein